MSECVNKIRFLPLLAVHKPGCWVSGHGCRAMWGTNNMEQPLGWWEHFTLLLAWISDWMSPKWQMLSPCARGCKWLAPSPMAFCHLASHYLTITIHNRVKSCVTISDVLVLGFSSLGIRIDLFALWKKESLFSTDDFKIHNLECPPSLIL